MPHTRPTTDIAKEGLFNILENNLDLNTLETLDLFGGTGCISFELMSRGVKKASIIEKDPAMHSFIKKTAELLGFQQLQVLKSDVFTFIEQAAAKYSLIFAGPPYSLTRIEELPPLIFAKGLLLPGGWFILEHTPANDFKASPFFRTERNYGTTVFSVFIMPADKNESCAR
jgi:16S rRNA (guanine(966)-N(2))-methyltransferase RsmD